jgi:hypothetical protein
MYDLNFLHGKVTENAKLSEPLSSSLELAHPRVGHRNSNPKIFREIDSERNSDGIIRNFRLFHVSQNNFFFLLEMATLAHPLPSQQPQEGRNGSYTR